MLKSLHLENVGPAEEMSFTPVARRFNLLTGDNGLGKSFLLDTAWWALTRTWHETPAVPRASDAAIRYAFDGDRSMHHSTASWDPASQTWKRKAGRPPNPGLILYARLDGSFSTWDPARNYRLYQRPDGGQAESPAAYQFSSQAVMEGLRRTVTEGGIERDQVICAGLIDDWTRWQGRNAPQFKLLERLLSSLGPDGEPLVPGTPMRPTLDDTRLIPTVRMPYGQDVPLTYAPAGVRRICKLAYLLAWTLSEHQEEAKRIGQPLAPQVIVLIDEPETHLHPRWQRTVLRGLMSAIEGWHTKFKPEVQFLVATHSPLVLASMEPIFDPKRDALWKLDLVDGRVQLEKDDWHKRGDATQWLVSDVFDLSSATSAESEQARSRAAALFAKQRVTTKEMEKTTRDLEQTLPEFDPFLIRWRYFVESKSRSASK